MKNKIYRLFALTFTLLFAVNIFCVKAGAVNDYGQYIFDDANLLTEDEFNSLNSYAKEISEYYQCGVHILTTDDPAVNADTIRRYGEDTYLQYTDFGWGEDKDGFFLVLATYERDYVLLAYGPWGNYALTDYGKEQMSEEFLDDFRNNDWYGGFSDYLSYASYVLDCAINEQPVDIYYSEQHSDVGFEAYGIAAVIGVIAAFVTCSIYKGQMRTAVVATKAEEYVDIGNTEIRTRRDMFRYMTRTQTKVASENNNRGGTSVNSRGFSGRQGKF
ncbi:MAG: TPM domain-containing protein [Oscillospiraceae bacterium]|nr:TPM domain-containing protein [Oscillospiraceae bacterium]